MPDNFPMPNVDDALERLGNATYYSCIDLKSGFHNIPVLESCQKYTTFIT